MSYRAKKARLFPRFLMLLFISLCLLFVYFYNINFKPILIQLSTSRAASIGQFIISEAVSETMKKEETAQNKMIIIDKDESGRINAIQPNYMSINRMKSEIALTVQDRFYNLDSTRIYIPLGNVTGVELFSDLGPRLPVNMIPYGKANVDFQTSFTEAGINQTRLQIAVSVKLDVSLLMPNNTSAGTTVSTTIPMSETIIVGDVPSSYTNLETMLEKLRDDLLHLRDN
jgi:sporulation protein YunB